MPLRLAQQPIIDWSVQLDLQRVHLHVALITPKFVSELKHNTFVIHGSNFDTVTDVQRVFNLGMDVLSTGHLAMALQVKADRIKVNQP